MKPSSSQVPRHIGLIMDGNRRFAKRLMLKPWKGHEWGAKKVEQVVEWSIKAGVKELTFYAFSIENFDRPKQEFDYLINIFGNEIKSLLKKDSIAHKNKARINFIGRISMFPESLQRLTSQLQEETKNYNDIVLNFALAYGGRAEIIDAAKKISEQIKKGKLNVDDINEDVFRKNLYLESEPDLIIRTGGEKRISGFLLYQGSYSELFFVDNLWPEFSKENFNEALEEYAKRDRRFGR